ncbi:Nuclease precursor [compost metagenome]
MQGLLRLKLATFLLTPLIGACASPHVLLPADQPDSLVAAPTVIDHCAVGCPAGGDAVTLYRQAYTLNNNGSTKFANWVAYRITKESPAVGRPRNWKKDPDVPVGETLNPVDYNGASVALKMDRGHQATLASMGGGRIGRCSIPDEHYAAEGRSEPGCLGAIGGSGAEPEQG